MDDGAIFAELHSALRRFAAAVRPPGVDPDDLMQEALARTLRRTSLAELDQPLGYLRRAILNLATGQRRTFVKRKAIASRMGGRHRLLSRSLPVRPRRVDGGATGPAGGAVPPPG